MSSVDILVPDLPESVADATVATWHKKPGDAVVRDEVLVEIETDKVVLEVPASADGILDAVLEDKGTTVRLVRSLVACVKARAPVKKPAPNLKRKRPLRRNASRRLWKSKTTMR